MYAWPTPLQLVESARSHDYTDLIIVTETRGEPDGLVVSHLPYGPTAYFSLNNAVLRHDIEDRATISEAYPHIILNEFQTSLVRSRCKQGNHDTQLL